MKTQINENILISCLEDMDKIMGDAPIYSCLPPTNWSNIEFIDEYGSSTLIEYEKVEREKLDAPWRAILSNSWQIADLSGYVEKLAAKSDDPFCAFAARSWLECFCETAKDIQESAFSDFVQLYAKDGYIDLYNSEISGCVRDALLLNEKINVADKFGNDILSCEVVIEHNCGDSVKIYASISDENVFENGPSSSISFSDLLDREMVHDEFSKLVETENNDGQTPKL